MEEGVETVEELVKGIVEEYWHWMSKTGGIDDKQTKNMLAQYLYALFMDDKFIQFMLRVRTKI